MNTRPRSSTAERFGRWLGRGWRGYVRRERRAVAWLASVGVPSGAATALVWIVKLAVLGVLLYAAFWPALLLVFVTAAAWASAANSPDEDAWPFTDMDELRNTPGYDPNLYNDHTHVDYKDD